MTKTKTDEMCDLIVAYMTKQGRDVRLSEITEMLCEAAPDAAKHRGFYVWHLSNRAIIQRVKRGIYRLTQPQTGAPDQ
jgi:hypothetical protein